MLVDLVMPPFALWAFIFTTFDLASVFSERFSQIVLLLAGFEPSTHVWGNEAGLVIVGELSRPVALGRVALSVGF